jgi:hypothetical protein
VRTKTMRRHTIVGVVALVAVIGWLSVNVNQAAEPAANPVTPPASDAAAEIAGLKAEITQLKAEIEQLKCRTPDQSHVMKDVGYHFASGTISHARATCSASLAAGARHLVLERL